MVFHINAQNGFDLLRNLNIDPRSTIVLPSRPCAAKRRQWGYLYMYAVIESGGKQYRVEPGDVIDIERTPVTGEKVQKVKFDRVLLVGGDEGVQIGNPEIKGAEVTGVLVNQVRGPKVRVFKMKRRKGYRRSQGHRQDLLRVEIDSIKAAGSGSTKSKTTEPDEEG